MTAIYPHQQNPKPDRWPCNGTKNAVLKDVKTLTESKTGSMASQQEGGVLLGLKSFSYRIQNRIDGIATTTVRRWITQGTLAYKSQNRIDGIATVTSRWFFATSTILQNPKPDRWHCNSTRQRYSFYGSDAYRIQKWIDGIATSLLISTS